MKLTTEQIEYVSNYVKSFDIKWYELQVELTDHMVNSMEEIWGKEPELTFHQVKQYAEDCFGRNGFNAIEEDRTQILRKEFRNAQRKMITEYQVFFYFENPSKYITGLFGLLYLFLIPILFGWFKNRKINGERFLAV